ncbi:MAG: DUF4831 family protein [Bacteroidales bacterium]|jgi:hypothetical protein|nr:DUF4831 family protein [Bacteroidales bacterium]
MKRYSFLAAVVLLMASCATTKNETTISPYKGSESSGHSALVYGLPQTRLYFEVELVKTIVKKGPYAEYASRMLGLQNVPMKDAESWQIGSIRINDKQEVDNAQLYTVSFIDYPGNMDRLLRFTKEGLLLDVSGDNILASASYSGKGNEDMQFMSVATQPTVTEKVDTIYKTVLTDTAFVKIPVLQRKVLGKTAEEQAREAATQIFSIRQWRLDVLSGNTDYHPEGAALKLVLEAFDAQEEQLLSLFNGARVESRYVYTYSALPDKPSTTTSLFYFSDRAGIVNKNTAGAKEVWYRVGEAGSSTSVNTSKQASNIVYYRIPQVVEVSAGIDKNVLVSRQKTVYQFGNIVSFPLLAPKK